ncbi:hypothetical protein M9434_004891 [Picochlorum sp. BPE23]|nr:hypothetical protein M9434_004888 [Picochlorum sp. BPE23]KAI8111319.1 hypothetical protein M9434_004891 [Picochlorum sp. BPE23]
MLTPDCYSHVTPKLQKFVRKPYHCKVSFLAISLLFLTRFFGAFDLNLLYAPRDSSKKRVLVLYIFSPTDSEYWSNFEFFYDKIREDDGVFYIVVLQQIAETHYDIHNITRGRYLRNVRFIAKPNGCFDLGTVGWVISKKVRYSMYDYVIWVNSSVRGPFMPPSLRQFGHHWTTIFIHKLNAYTKAVGCTISCEINPHIQSYVVCMETRFLLHLLRTTEVFHCYFEFQDEINKGEVALSREIFMSGYNIDCLMDRYQGIDWKHAWEQKSKYARCNYMVNPLLPGPSLLARGPNTFPIDLYEVLFVKVKEHMLHDHEYAQHASFLSKNFVFDY